MRACRLLILSASLAVLSAQSRRPTVSWEFTPDPKLPNVLIIDDSISMGYTPLVRTLLQGKANVIHAFRLELFNAFNHPKYPLPNSNVSDGATAATINRLIRDMREAQFALRFDF